MRVFNKGEMKLYRVQKNQNDEFEIISNDVLYERDFYGGEYVIHQNGSPDGSCSIVKAIACYTEQEAIEAYAGFLQAKINDYKMNIEIAESEILQLCELAVEKESCTTA